MRNPNKIRIFTGYSIESDNNLAIKPKCNDWLVIWLHTYVQNTNAVTKGKIIRYSLGTYYILLVYS